MVRRNTNWSKQQAERRTHFNHSFLHCSINFKLIITVFESELPPLRRSCARSIGEQWLEDFVILVIGLYVVDNLLGLSRA
jgi:hypothetical protein